MEISRRTFIKSAAALGVCECLDCQAFFRDPRLLLNDVHSELNPTSVRSIARPTTVAQVQDVVKRARNQRLPISVAGSRHAMGGQQFRTDALHIDITTLKRPLGLDEQNGIVEAEAGIEWPELQSFLERQQVESKHFWSIIQKQTGTDRLTLAGSLAANVHSRGLKHKPFIADVESFRIVDPNGELLICSRTQNPELFKLAIGGYGLFGIITSVRLRLQPRQKLRRVVRKIQLSGLMDYIEDRIRAGCTYGDCQYSTDAASPGFMRDAVVATYEPVTADAPLSDGGNLPDQAWRDLYHLAHTDKAAAFQRYVDYQLTTSGRIEWSDLQQFNGYIDNYHQRLNQQAPRKTQPKASEILTEIYVPRPKFAQFVEDIRADFIKYDTNLIYGTVRFIEADDESFLPWARQRFACLIFNLHTVHTPAGIHRSAEAFRRLIDRALAHQGSYYLTYHRFATRAQVEACHPSFLKFLQKKRVFDPEERFQSDWYDHHRRLFA